MNANLTYLAYKCIYIPKIRYVLHVTRFSREQCKIIQKELFKKILPSMMISRKFPREVLLGPISSGVIGLIDIYHLQGSLKLNMLISILRMNHPLRNILLCNIEMLQLSLGIQRKIFIGKFPKKFTSNTHGFPMHGSTHPTMTLRSH